MLRQVKGAVRLAAKTTAARRGSALYAWIMEKSKFVAGKGPSFADRRNVVQAAKNISISSLWSQGLFAIQHWLRGEDVKQMPGNWSVIDRLAEGAEHAKVKQNLQVWLREKNIRRHPSRRCLREYRIGQHLQQDVPPVEEEEYTKRLEEHPKNCDFEASGATLSHEMDVGRQKLRKNCDFTYSIVTLSHEIDVGRQKLRKNCDFTVSIATLSSV